VWVDAGGWHRSGAATRQTAMRTDKLLDQCKPIANGAETSPWHRSGVQPNSCLYPGSKLYVDRNC
jgi:hypothetical protein